MGLRVVANEPAIAPALERIDRPFMHFVASRRFAEIDLAVRGDVEIIGQPQP